MKERVAFVLGGGGSRGALQVGALRALLEHEIYPDMLVGTSAGAINATFLAMNGFTKQSISELESAWDDAAQGDLLPANYLWLTVRAVFNRARIYPTQRLRDFFIDHGVTPEMRFVELSGPQLIQVAADLKNYRPYLYGIDPEQSILEGLIASTALPPWLMPLEVQDHFLIDGGVISNLPVEAALTHGATRIYAFDLSDPSEIEVETQGFGAFYSKLVATIEERQIFLELALAEARRIPVHYLRLKAVPPVPIWDFSYTRELIAQGYQATHEFLDGLQPREQSSLQRWAVTMGDRLRSFRKLSMEQDHHNQSRDGNGF